MKMSSLRSRYGAAAAFVGGLALTFVLIGCGGEGEAEPGPTATLMPPTPTPEGASALPLDRFHYVASLTLRPANPKKGLDTVAVSTNGDFQAPDRHSFTYTTRFGDATVDRSLIVIDERAWLREGRKQWRDAALDDPAVAGLQRVAFNTTQPGFLGGPEYQQMRDSLRRLPSTDETVNGVPSEHYRVTAKGREFFETFLSGGQLAEGVDNLRWDLWLAKDGGWPVRLRASGTVKVAMRVLEELRLLEPVSLELRIDISRPGDPTLVIRPPVESK